MSIKKSYRSRGFMKCYKVNILFFIIERGMIRVITPSLHGHNSHLTWKSTTEKSHGGECRKHYKHPSTLTFWACCTWLWQCPWCSWSLSQSWSKTTLNNRMMVERYSNLKEEVSSSNHGCEISSILDGKLARWSTTSCDLALACLPFVSKKRKEKTIFHKVG